MNKKIKASIAFIIVIFLCFILYDFFYVSLPLKNEIKYSDEINSWLDSRRNFISAGENNSELIEKEKKFSSLMERVVEKGNSKLKEIEFYGAVIDQNGSAVSGAEVIYDLSGLYLSPGSGIAKVTTDERGLFFLKNGKGLSLSIIDIDKPGYTYIKSSESASKNPSRIAATQWQLTSEQKPFTFTIWKIDELPKLKRGERHIYSSYDDEIYSLFILDNNNLRIKKGDLSGDFVFVFMRHAQSWKFSIECVGNGGVQEIGPIYEYIAPEENYTQKIEYEDSIDVADFKKEFYFFAKNRTRYGYLKVEVNPDFRKGYAIYLTYVINLEGGRSLVVEQPLQGY